MCEDFKELRISTIKGKYKNSDKHSKQRQIKEINKPKSNLENISICDRNCS